MRFHKFLLPFFLLAFTTSSFAQRIVYSQPGDDDTRRMNFEVIGKVSGNFLIYKNSRGKSFVSVYNNDMEEVSKIEQEYIPDDRLINAATGPLAICPMASTWPDIEMTVARVSESRRWLTQAL